MTGPERGHGLVDTRSGLLPTTSRTMRRKRLSSFSPLRAGLIFVFVSLVYLAWTNGIAGVDDSATLIGGGAGHVFQGSRHLLQDDGDDPGVTSASASNTTLGDTPPTESRAARRGGGGGRSGGGGGGGDDDDDPLFPEDLFTDEQLRSGAIACHIIGIIYMFYALAIVCDDFFVPSLDVITEKLGISPDVAGATFMAAGGSAPELFTSIIGVFIAKNDVGIGTIVGSAVFNILFVIAACAFAAKEALKLTAWPLIRDVFFYSVSLIVLVVFFGDNRIEWYEALILFLWYGAYVGFMKFSDSVEDSMRQCFKLPPVDREDKVRGVTLRQAQNRKGLFRLMNETVNPGILKKRSLKKKPTQEGEEMKPLNKFGADEKGIMIGEGGAGPVGLVTGGGGISSLKCHLQENEGVAAGNGASGDDANNGLALTVTVGDDENNKAELSNEVKIVDGSGDDDDDEGDEPIDISFPRDGDWKNIVIYLVSIPIMLPLFLTLPDTKNPSKRKYFAITFVGSILWIAVFSYLMVWWATVAGEVFFIPPPIMGLTFLAAGTSVPDLITSVLVAKQGKGDMAVSSSVGSNIFDVTVGLPVPWLLFCLLKGASVTVNSAGVGCSISLLFLMLILVFLAIIIFKWQMTKGMGVLMLILYVAFVIVSLGFTYQWYVCPI